MPLGVREECSVVASRQERQVTWGGAIMIIHARPDWRNDIPDAMNRLVASLSRSVPLALVFVCLAGSEGFSKVNSDWSLVRNIPLGSRVLVVIQDNPNVSQDTRKIKGQLSMYDSMSITLQSSPIQSRKIEKDSVVKIFIRRPLIKRTPGWIALAISGISAQVFVSYVGDTGALGAVMAHALITGSMSVSFFRGFRWKRVYSLPHSKRGRSRSP